MKKLLAIGATTLAAVLLGAPAVRASIVDLLTFQAAVDAAQAVDPTLAAPANDGNHDFAVGGFQRNFSPQTGGHTGFSAQSAPNGGNPSGQVTSTFDSSPNSGSPGTKQRWDVVCLAVSGSDAAMGLVPRNAPPSNTATPRGLSVHDGGPGGALDKYTFNFDSPRNCRRHVFDAAFAGFTLASGNILVHDEP